MEAIIKAHLDLEEAREKALAALNARLSGAHPEARSTEYVTYAALVRACAVLAPIINDYWLQEQATAAREARSQA